MNERYERKRAKKGDAIKFVLNSVKTNDSANCIIWPYCIKSKDYDVCRSVVTRIKLRKMWNSV